MRRQAGLTLLEVLVASVIMSTIAVLAFNTLDVAERSKEISEEKMRDLLQFDRAWVMLENDLRNALSHANGNEFGEPTNCMEVSYGGDYNLIFLRAGRANPLGFPRTELARVGYRLEENVLWRDTWVDAWSPARDIDYARQQKLLEGVEDMKIRVMHTRAQGYDEGPWVEEWPGGEPPGVLPLAIEITLETENRGEITRLFSLSLGK
ncbi:type II secretion system minor pseudopilin GspJ [Teredinibacter haidensis]|uniref:type II secretion system minor pseudopilin GspJ n=1 Tax=Teredinibacter haidensis TaxID=2731755 RepID=UPI000948D75A|nr:type II secretion system minor pseudopilin GspJ [Teredinibacter haidensis]